MFVSTLVIFAHVVVVLFVRVWNFNDEAGYSQVLHLDVPRSVVPGSERGTLLVAGGMALPGAGDASGRSGSRMGSQQPQDEPDDLGLQQPHAGQDAGETSRWA